MTTGAELPARARAGDEIPAADPEHAAVVAALLSQYRPADAALIRRLTEVEIDRVDAARDGCGDVLLAC